MTAWSSFGLALAALLMLTTLLWLASLRRRDASIVDVFWGPGFAVAAWIYRVARETPTWRGDLVAALVSLWALRLAVHILWRGWGKGEDYRYREMRERCPGTFPLLVRVSGVALLEKKLRETRPAYRRYAEETSAFFPWVPRRSAAGRR